MIVYPKKRGDLVAMGKLAAVLAVVASVWCVPASAQPANDNCIDAISLTENVAAQYTTHNATDEAALTCQGTADVWFEWTATLTGNVQVALSDNSPAVGTGIDTNHSVYLNSVPGSCPIDADQLACIDPFIGTVAVTAGTSYLIRVGMWSSSTISRAQGDVTVFTPAPEVCDDGIDNDFDGLPDCADTADCSADPACQPPANDNCIDAITLVENVASAYTTNSATNEAALTCRGTADVWFEWTATLTDSIDVTLSNNTPAVGVGTDTNHSVYTNPGGGLCPTDIDLLACSDPFSTSVAVVSGTSYLIRVGMWSSFSTSRAQGDVTVLTPVAEVFVRGDFDNNGVIGIIDAIQLLTWAFLNGTPPTCMEAIDFKANGVPSLILEAIEVLTYLFLSGTAPPSPFPFCEDGTALDCSIGTSSCP